MFDALSNRLNGIFEKLRGRGALSEEDVKSSMREIRIALLEADVSLPVVKDFITRVQEKAVGQDVLKSITPGQQIVKIVHDELKITLGDAVDEISVKAAPPAVVMMVGLQGSGKTSMTAKLANYLKNKQGKRVVVASLDVYRPAAQTQLEVLAKSIGVASLEILDGQKPLDITKRALKEAKLGGYDLLILDTAGRLHIDDELMGEVAEVEKISTPAMTILVADSMVGQDAANVAKAFSEKLRIDAVALSRIDGDARGGAALSMRFITGKPILMLGTGEKPSQYELFHPDRIAGRILGMGDIVGLVERAMENIDHEQAAEAAMRMQKGKFDMNDMMAQLSQVNKMGGLGSLMGMLPGGAQLNDAMSKMNVDDSFIKKQIAIITSMTKKERENPDLLNASRKKRIATGSGVTIQEINKLYKQFRDMAEMTKRMKKLGKKGLMRQGLKGLMPHFGGKH